MLLKMVVICSGFLSNLGRDIDHDKNEFYQDTFLRFQLPAYTIFLLLKALTVPSLSLTVIEYQLFDCLS